MEGGIGATGAFQGRNLKPHGQGKAGIRAAPAGAAHIAFDDGDIKRGITPLQLDGSPV